MTRTDVHRPSAINPTEYVFVAHEFLKVDDLGDALFLQEERKRIQAHMKMTGGTYSHHEHGGNCMVCGSVNAIYTILFYHADTNTYVRMGSDCAQKCEMSGDYDSNAFRRAIQDAREAYAGKRKAQALLADAGLQRAWDVYLKTFEPIAMPGYKRGEYGEWVPEAGGELSEQDRAIVQRMYWAQAPGKEEMTIRDIVGKLIRYGSVSDKALNYVRTLLERIDTREEREAQRKLEHEAAAPCPSGRLEITGTILSVKYDADAMYPGTRILVQADSGFKVYGTRPINAERGDRIRFSAQVIPSKDDPKFGFFKRPTKAKVLERAAPPQDPSAAQVA